MKSITYKIFIFLNLLIYGFIILYFLLNYLFLEDYQIRQKKKQIISIGEMYNSQNFNELQTEWEERGIILKEINPGNLFMIPAERREKIKSLQFEELIIGKLSQKDSIYELYSGRNNTTKMVFAKKLPNGNILFITSGVRPIKEFLKISFRFFLYIVLSSIPINLYIAYIISLKLGKPIESELLELNTQLKEELMKEKKLDQFRKEFIANITHELKTPVAIISGYSNAIIDGIIPAEEIENICKNINTEANNMDSLIKELLFYSKMEWGYIHIKKEKIDIKKMIENILNRYSLDIRSKNIKINIDLDEIYIFSDGNLLERCINNIFINALAYCDNRNKISITLKKEFIQIKNTSLELDEKTIEECFKPFSKKHEKKNKKYGGTGLGLSIVSEILKNLNLNYEMFFDKKNGEIIFQIKL